MDKAKFNEPKEWRKFAIGLAIILAILATIQVFTGSHYYIYFYAASVLVLLASLLLPVVIKPLFILFSYVGLALGWIMTRLIVTIVFFLILTPIGLISRLFNKKYLDLGFKENQESYWRVRENPSSDKASFERQF